MQNQSNLLKISSYYPLVLIFLLFVPKVQAQKMDLQSDLLLADSVIKQRVPASVKRVYIYKNQPKTFKNSNPVSLIYGGALYVYQNIFSQHLSASCLYTPSCSEFSKQAVRQFGLIKGTLLSFDRLSRCNRIAATDLHPEEIDLKTNRFDDSIKKYK